MFTKVLADLRTRHKPRFMALEIWKYIGPGLLVTVGFIDPGNWASNVAAGAGFGYKLLWMVTLSTVMLIVLQHNAAHLGIATGLCLSEGASRHLPPWASRPLLGSAVLASVSTALAELLGGAIALRMIFGIPLWLGGLMVLALVSWMLFANSYKRLERAIIGFVSLIGLSFVFELAMVEVDWLRAAAGWVVPSFPEGSIPVIMSVLGAVVMPHNLFLHSEVIQSRQWNLDNDEVIRHQLKYEFMDTLVSMIVGWAINSAMILLAASAFHTAGVQVTELEQAQSLLVPLVGGASALVFAAALLLAGVASSVTAGMAGGAIFAGIFNEPYNIRDVHTRVGVAVTLFAAYLLILVIPNPFQGLIVSQIVLSVQLPFTVLLQLYLTSSKKVMGKWANKPSTTALLAAIAAAVIGLNIMLLVDIFGG
ncbi:MAG: Nramp family divalent metal transporter [Acidobacteriota bacterium]